MGGDNQDWYPFMHPNGWLNDPPVEPNRPSGQTFGITGVDYTYTAVTIDLENYSIYYNFSWGDDSYSGWLGPYESGELVNSSHTWTEIGVYPVMVKAKDTRGYESEWSDAINVRILSFHQKQSVAI
jgi:hypothetical protein